MDPSDLTIIIPTLNEDKNIGRLIDKIQSLLPKSNIIVVDDGSSDDTQEIVLSKNNNVSLIDRSDEEIHGLTISIRDGIQECQTDTFMVIDGDFQHPPDALLEAVTCFKQGGDLVIGRRIKVENWPFTRKLMSKIAQWLGKVSLFFRRRQIPSDIMSGYFGGRKEVIEPIIDDENLALKGYKLLFDILKKFPRDKTIKEFGYIFKNREYGDSKIGKTQILEYFKSLF